MWPLLSCSLNPFRKPNDHLIWDKDHVVVEISFVFLKQPQQQHEWKKFEQLFLSHLQQIAGTWVVKCEFSVSQDWWWWWWWWWESWASGWPPPPNHSASQAFQMDAASYHSGNSGRDQLITRASVINEREETPGSPSARRLVRLLHQDLVGSK